MQAAILAHGIAQNQSFLDGNKRTAVIAMSTFLALNGWDVDVPNSRLAQLIPTLLPALPTTPYATGCAPVSPSDPDSYRFTVAPRMPAHVRAD